MKCFPCSQPSFTYSLMLIPADRNCNLFYNILHFILICDNIIKNHFTIWGILMEYNVRFRNNIFKHAIDISNLPEESIGKDHVHSVYELLFFIQGAADYVNQGRRYSLQEFSFLVICPGEFHSLIIKEGKPCERIVIRFSMLDISPILRTSLSSLKRVYNLNGSSIIEELFRFDSLYSKLGPERCREVFLWQLNILLSSLISASNLHVKAESVNQKMNDVLSFIDSNLNVLKTLNDLCHGLHMSRSSVHALFSEQMGVPAAKYIRTQKCIRAHELICEGMPSVAAAQACGFRDYSTFYRNYIQLFSCAPSFHDTEVKSSFSSAYKRNKKATISSNCGK